MKADQIAREIINDCLQQLDNRLAPKIVERRVAAALTAAHTAGFNEAKGRAVEIAQKEARSTGSEGARGSSSYIAQRLAALQEGKDG